MRTTHLVAAAAALMAFAGCAGVATRSPDEIDDAIARIAGRLESIQDKTQQLGYKLDRLEGLLKNQAITKTSTAARSSKPKPISKILRSGIKVDPHTRTLQRALKAADYDPGPEDGKFGRRTTAALKKFQRDNDLSETGMADDDTLALLKRYID
jgi:peptidoglycan hydrolase-like protein with peptidoglycan-binding domain